MTTFAFVGLYRIQEPFANLLSNLIPHAEVVPALNVHHLSPDPEVVGAQSPILMHSLKLSLPCKWPETLLAGLSAKAKGWNAHDWSVG